MSAILSLFYCLHTNSICILLQLLVKYGNYSNKRCICRCCPYQRGGAYQREALISMQIPKGAALFRRRCLFEARRLLENIRQSKKNGRSLQLREDWARKILICMNWVKSKDTTGKVEPSQQFLLEEKLTFQKKISSVIFYHDIRKESVVNLSQTPLFYVIPDK